LQQQLVEAHMAIEQLRQQTAAELAKVRQEAEGQAAAAISVANANAAQQAASATSKGSNLKPKGPGEFKGRLNEDPAEWCFSVEAYFKARGNTNGAEHLAYVVALLEESAKSWWRLRVENPTAYEPIYDYASFKPTFIAKFSTVDRVRKARVSWQVAGSWALSSAMHTQCAT